MTCRKFGTLDSGEKTIAILGDRWRPQTAKQEGDEDKQKSLHEIYGENVMSAQTLEVYLLGAGIVFHLERNA